MRVAERFTRRYDSLLREFQEEMLNTSGLLDQLNRQFGWVSRLANYSLGPDGFLQVTTVSPRGWGRQQGWEHQKWDRATKGPLCSGRESLGAGCSTRMGAKVRGACLGLSCGRSGLAAPDCAVG